jgi:hypothetical protein
MLSMRVLEYATADAEKHTGTSRFPPVPAMDDGVGVGVGSGENTVRSRSATTAWQYMRQRCRDGGCENRVE